MLWIRACKSLTSSGIIESQNCIKVSSSIIQYFVTVARLTYKICLSILHQYGQETMWEDWCLASSWLSASLFNFLPTNKYLWFIDRNEGEAGTSWVRGVAGVVLQSHCCQAYQACLLGRTARGDWFDLYARLQPGKALNSCPWDVWEMSF